MAQAQAQAQWPIFSFSLVLVYVCNTASGGGILLFVGAGENPRADV